MEQNLDYKKDCEEALDSMEEEYKKGKIGMAMEIISLIKQRKWVWNEDKFGSVKNHKMFDEFVYELISEVKRLKINLEKEVENEN